MKWRMQLKYDNLKKTGWVSKKKQKSARRGYTTRMVNLYFTDAQKFFRLMAMLQTKNKLRYTCIMGAVRKKLRVL